MTGRLATACGGAATRPAVFACGPITDSRPGGTAARVITGVVRICDAFTATALRFTGCALTKARCGTAATAPCTLRLT